MAKLPILEYPDPRLRLRSEPVAEFDADLARLVDDMIETVHAAKGIGLSAPQIDVLKRVAVPDLSEDQSDPKVYINPEVLSSGRIGIVEESCLSLPGVVGNVIRPTHARVRAQDITGETFEQELDGMDAVSLLHEVDHLDGKLFVDRLLPHRRLLFRLTGKSRARKRAAARQAEAASAR